jgi:predicted ATPase/class 3 adenylate cyclase/DNA-binding CsgD family transcriptional regulator
VPFSVPTGIVTFLLTDIESSTSSWEVDGAAMGPAVSRHYELLDECVARWAGVRPVEQGEGDSIVAAFSRPSDAVNAALDAQRALLAELADQFRVRMALHTGEAQLRDEANYFGRTVIRCARLRSCAHGGQVVLSAAAADLVADDLPPGTELHDLGLHRLRDLHRPERVYELCHPDLPGSGSFPPLRSLEAFRHNLPVQLTPLVGRDTELGHLEVVVATERLVTLIGTGGCGKTRLAAELGARLVDRFPGGVWWCELAARGGEGVVALTLATLLGVQEQPGPDLVPAVAARLATMGPTLVVLDNAEHVLDDAANATSTLLGVAPDVTVLVTSREPLSVPGEVAWRVPSLGTPPLGAGAPPVVAQLAEFAAVELFVERAARARPGFALDDDNAAAVAAICQRLDGIPLAIELAAARVRTLTPARIAAQLDDRFRLLTGGTRTLLPRQQTLLASVAWSEELLDPTERAALRRLGVFVGGFGLEAAEEVLGSFDDIDPYEVLDVVGHLVDKSLVALEDTGRYRLLETMRSYALGRLLDAGEADQAREAHATWALRAAEEHDATDERDDRFGWFEALEPDWPNMAAALDWLADRPDERLRLVAALGRFWLIGARLQDVIAYGLETIERFAGDPPPSWHRAVAGCCAPLGNAGEMIAEHLDRAWELARAEGDELAALRIELSQATQSMGAGAIDDDAAVWESLAERGRALGCTFVVRNAVMSPWQLKMVAGRMAEVSVEPPEDFGPFPRSAGVAAFGAMLTGDLRGAAAHLARASSLPNAAPPERVLLESNDLWLGVLSGGRHGGALAATRTAEKVELVGIYEQWYQLLLLRAAVRDRAWDRLPSPGAPEGPATVRRGPWSGVIRCRFRALLAPALVAAGRVDEARAVAGELVEEGTRIGAPLAVVEADLVLAELDADPDRAYDALAVARENNLVLAQIDALEVLAVLAHHAGAHEHAALLKATTLVDREARDYLFRWPNRDTAFAEIPVPDPTVAVELERAVELALRGRGARGRPALGWSSLTPTEVEVATEVAAGRTNAEVATRLGMSSSTVKTHLEHIYAKLGVHRRSALATLVATRGPALTADG